MAKAGSDNAVAVVDAASIRVSFIGAAGNAGGSGIVFKAIGLLFALSNRTEVDDAQVDEVTGLRSSCDRDRLFTLVGNTW